MRMICIYSWFPFASSIAWKTRIWGDDIDSHHTVFPPPLLKQRKTEQEVYYKQKYEN